MFSFFFAVLWGGNEIKLIFCVNNLHVETRSQNWKHTENHTECSIHTVLYGVHYLVTEALEKATITANTPLFHNLIFTQSTF